MMNGAQPNNEGFLIEEMFWFLYIYKMKMETLAHQAMKYILDKANLFMGSDHGV